MFAFIYCRYYISFLFVIRLDEYSEQLINKILCTAITEGKQNRLWQEEFHSHKNCLRAGELWQTMEILGYQWNEHKSNDVLLREAALRRVNCMIRERQLRLCGATPCRRSRASDPISSGSDGLDHAEGLPACFVVASGGSLSEGYGRPASAWAMVRRKPNE